MDLDIGLVMNLYKERLSNVENELIIANAQIITLQQELDNLLNKSNKQELDN